ncbi:MAG: pyridoxal-phosphate dependent enzyme [Beijerinckiaceae bacterium]|nr:pyridoxal-phosphate dependent enzyme [Beijerinckiaceae bacterium]
MVTRVVHNSPIEASLLPTFIRLAKNLVAATFGFMKLIPATFILEQAEKDERLKAGKIIETTSGPFGLALAIVAAQRNYSLTLLCPKGVDPAILEQMANLGAKVEVLLDQQECIDQIQARRSKDRELFWPSQYHNPQNSGSYAGVAEAILEAMGNVDCLIGAVGSGGSLCGTGKYLRLVGQDLRVVAVDAMGSVLFGKSSVPGRLPGMGNGVMPTTLEHRMVDEVHWVTSSEALCAARRLHKFHGMCMGTSSGAAFLASSWWASKNPDKTAVVFFPDHSSRLFTSLFCKETLQAADLWLDELPSEPKEISHPREESNRWSRLEWARRSLNSWELAREASE